MLAYDQLGASPARVLLLHGFLGSARNLATLARRMCERAPALGVLTVDLPGHGRSPPLPEDADLAQMAAPFVTMLDGGAFGALEPPVHVIGHSLGGRVALRLFDLRPDLVSRVTLLDISPGPVSGDGLTRRTVTRLLEAPPTFPDRATARAFLIEGGISAPIADWLLMNLRAQPGHARAVEWRIDRGALHTFIERTGAEDLWPTAELLAERLAAARGSESTYVPDADFERLAALGAAPLATLRGAGHFVHVDALPELLEFLQSVRARSRRAR